MDKTTLENLEYPVVLEGLSSYAVSSPGSVSALSLLPSVDYAWIRGEFDDYAEARAYLALAGSFPLGGVDDIAGVLRFLGPEGAYLLPEELLRVKANVEASEALRVLKTADFERQYPRLFAKISVVSDESGLLRELGRVLDERGFIRDSASPALLSIRREIRSSRERARRILDEFSAEKKIKEILQEEIITVRDDRFVLVVKAGKHTEVPGIIHGRSGSGQSYFIEPAKLFDLNNRISILKKDEAAEEIAVLKATSAIVLGKREELLCDQDVLSGFDLMQAKVRWAKAYGATMPAISCSGAVRLKGARHPLLVKKGMEAGFEPTAIDLAFDDDTMALVISGANTGGKTVALKTLGLLTLLAQSGVPVPVKEGSEAIVFGSVFADIGDRQDIIASLSTFSAHVKRLEGFISHVGAGSLVLIDEIGAGTDPSEGGALAIATLETLIGKGARVAVTTHLNHLKAYAQTHAAYRNASVEFDEGSLRPLYTLRYGTPGQSLGLFIAKSLGIGEELINRARALLDDREAIFMDSVSSIEAQKEELRAHNARLAELEAQRDEAVGNFRASRQKYLEKAAKKIDDAVAQAKEEIRRATAEFRASLGEKVLQSAPSKAARVVEDIGRRAKKTAPEKKAVYIPETGDKVTIEDTSTKAEVVRVDVANKRAELVSGAIKVWVAWDRLKKRGNKVQPVQKETLIDADIERGTSVNVIGMRVEEALVEVSKFLDAAHAAGYRELEIIHGIGEGKLARAVDEFLSESPLVKGRARPEGPGGAGVTIAVLK